MTDTNDNQGRSSYEGMNSYNTWNGVKFICTGIPTAMWMNEATGTGTQDSLI